MGVVYKARQLTLNRLVALKMIRNAEFASEDQVRRFQNEAEAVARSTIPASCRSMKSARMKTSATSA